MIQFVMNFTDFRMFYLSHHSFFWIQLGLVTHSHTVVLDHSWICCGKERNSGASLSGYGIDMFRYKIRCNVNDSRLYYGQQSRSEDQKTPMFRVLNLRFETNTSHRAIQIFPTWQCPGKAHEVIFSYFPLIFHFYMEKKFKTVFNNSLYYGKYICHMYYVLNFPLSGLKYPSHVLHKVLNHFVLTSNTLLTSRNKFLLIVSTRYWFMPYFLNSVCFLLKKFNFQNLYQTDTSTQTDPILFQMECIHLYLPFFDII